MAPQTDFEFDVAISFAGAQRYYADALRRHLDDYGVTVFYDEQQQPALWGRDLNEELTGTYGSKAFRVVMLISKEYVDRAYPQIERRAAFGAEIVRNDGVILPVRFDDVEVPGLTPQRVYQRAEGTTIEKLAELIVDTLIYAGRLDQTVKHRLGTQRRNAELVSFQSLPENTSGPRWRFEYTITNRSAGSIDSVVVVVPDAGRFDEVPADLQQGCAIAVVVGHVPRSETVRGSFDVDLEPTFGFSSLPYLATLLWSDHDGNHWSVCGPDLHRRPWRARTC